MNEWVKRGLMLSMVVGAIGVGASACADNESTIFVRQVLVPSGSDCSYSADPGSAARTLGVMDLAFTREYWAGLLISPQNILRRVLPSGILIHRLSGRIFVAGG